MKHPGMLPPELLTTVMTFLPGIKAIATCACVSRLWRQAAGQAVPRKVAIWGYAAGSMADHARRHAEELSQLLLKPCRLSAVTHVLMTSGGHQFLKGALFARICTEAAALQKVTMYDADHFDLVAGLVPVNLRSLTCGITRGRDLAPLSRLTQLEEFICGDPDDPLTQPLPQLPALRRFCGNTADLQLLSSVSATLEEIELTGFHGERDFRRQPTLAQFTRLHTLSVEVGVIRNFHPDVLPSTLRSITLVLAQDVEDPPGLDQSLVLPAGGQVAMDMDCDGIAITWKRFSPL